MDKHTVAAVDNKAVIEADGLEEQCNTFVVVDIEPVGEGIDRLVDS